ncbi:DUF3833 domain-containing protein [Thalassotalea sp. M1531]|uniref:DUF3833 domain-containing protein n=1 Tax=Thalassotalea algicola TaxID=2716224 RepID=A0A7Y0LEB6_9GAMM|nr:DUF3833 domain-containing protein [Thalassotalea algicola]NMP31585.1 DUF3833 domain-containing protein [Thalassotalea algicola]
MNMKALLICILAMTLSSCGTHIKEYENALPQLNLTEYFDGPMTAWGIVQDYNQKVTRRFCVELLGSWHENQGELKEKFYFNDGEVSYRTWQLTRKGNSYRGTAEDVTGVANGMTVGFAFQWQYNLQLSIDGHEFEFFLDDWMYQIDPYRVFNRTVMKKFGIEVAEITIFFDKQKPIRTCK